MVEQSALDRFEGFIKQLKEVLLIHQDEVEEYNKKIASIQRKLDNLDKLTSQKLVRYGTKSS
jgi:hypothetical protein